MILYQLHCEDDHTFEAWFRDSAAYDEQALSGHVECPYCGSTKVAKAPMAPAIAAQHSDHPAHHPAHRELSEADINAMSTDRAHEVAQNILDAVGQIRDYAEENFENMGEDFAAEARKIHDGEAQERGIYGRATEDEARELEDDGVEFVRLPGAPRRND